LKEEGSLDVFGATLNYEGVLTDEVEAIGLPKIPQFPLTSFYNANFIRQVRLCAKFLAENRIDLVHTHDFYTNVFGLAAATLAGIPARVASKRETDGMRSGSQEFVEKLAFSRANAIVANSEAVRSYLIDRSVSARKVHIIYNGIAVDRFTSADLDTGAGRQKFGLPHDEKIRFVTIVANLRHEVKNVPMLLRSARRIVESEPNVHFVIAGEGQLEAKIREMAIESGISDKVHFIGRCADIPSLLATSYVCVLTSIAEGFSNSILEYMAAGRPVVATAVGGAAEAIDHGVSGYLVASDDDERMADHLMEFLRDEEKAERFGSKGREIVAERFSREIRLKKTLELYGTLGVRP
jgi:glycosyltransferase involved in cell wall biosynthesis